MCLLSGPLRLPLLYKRGQRTTLSADRCHRRIPRQDRYRAGGLRGSPAFVPDRDRSLERLEDSIRLCSPRLRKSRASETLRILVLLAWPSRRGSSRRGTLPCPFR